MAEVEDALNLAIPGDCERSVLQLLTVVPILTFQSSRLSILERRFRDFNVRSNEIKIFLVAWRSLFMSAVVLGLSLMDWTKDKATRVYQTMTSFCSNNISTQIYKLVEENSSGDILRQVSVGEIAAMLSVTCPL